jgi:hypothetical protein
MKQIKLTGRIQLRMPDALASPTCDECRAVTRFVGLEAHPRDDSVDLCTYACDVCGHMQTGVIDRGDRRNGNGIGAPLLDG